MSKSKVVCATGSAGAVTLLVVVGASVCVWLFGLLALKWPEWLPHWLFWPLLVGTLLVCPFMIWNCYQAFYDHCREGGIDANRTQVYRGGRHR